MDKFIYVGLDIGKYQLSCSLPGAKPRDFPNTRAGIKALLRFTEKVADPARCCFVMEATGGYANFTALTLLKLVATQVAIVPPACILGFIKAKIRRTKNDRVDAVAIRQFGEVCEPSLWLPPSSNARHLRDLVLLVDMLKQSVRRKLNLLEKYEAAYDVDQYALRQLKRSIAREDQEREQAEARINELIAGDEALARDSGNMLTIPNVGPGVRNAMLCYCYRQLKELSQRKLLAHCGMCPEEHQSGTAKGYTRMNKGGDPRLRKVLYMAALGAIRQGGIMHDYFQLQREQGKPGKVALVHVMRKLLYLIQAVVKSGTPFDRELYMKAS